MVTPDPMPSVALNAYAIRPPVPSYAFSPLSISPSILFPAFADRKSQLRKNRKRPTMAKSLKKLKRINLLGGIE